MLASLAIGGLLLLAMVAASERAAAVLPADARIAIHCGSVEHGYLVKNRDVRLRSPYHLHVLLAGGAVSGAV
ncbi:MAG: hypothetical protein ACRDOE_10615 [Streptosporangiaceae bacterium]